MPLVTGNAESDLAGSLTSITTAGRGCAGSRSGNDGKSQPADRVHGQVLWIQEGARRHGTALDGVSHRSKFAGEMTVTPAEVLDKNLASTNYRVVLSLQK